MPRDTIALLSKRVRGTAVGQDYVDWAVNALIDGFDSSSLAILAGLDIGSEANHFEARKYFPKAVQELALPIPHIELAISLPDDEIGLRQHLDELAEQIKEGVIDPVTGVDRIHAEIVTPLNHPSDLMDWCYMWASIPFEGFAGDSKKEERLAEIIAFATTWIENKKQREQYHIMP